MELLRANDLTALEYFAASRTVLAVLPHAQLDALDSALAGLELDQAHALCAEMCAENTT